MSKHVSTFASALVAAAMIAGGASAADLPQAPAEQVFEPQQVQSGNLYAWIGGGVAILSDVGFAVTGTAAGVPFAASGDLEFDAGPTFAGGVGYNFNDYLALEAQLTYARFNYDSVNYRISTAVGTAVGAASIDGHMAMLTGLGNVIITPLGRDNRITPYIGGGVGAVHTWNEIDSVGAGAPAIRYSSSSTNLAASAIAGLDISLTERVDIGARYQFNWADTGGNGFDDTKSHALFLRANVAF